MNSIEKVWIKLLNKIISDGKWHVKDDDDRILESMINHVFIKNPVNDYDSTNMINSDIFIKMIKNNIIKIKGYQLKGDALADYVTALDNPEQIENKNEDGSDKFIYTYPERIFNMNMGDDFKLNQFELMCNRLTVLKDDEYWNGSNRAVVNIYNSLRDYCEDDIPCWNWGQITIRDNKLILHVMFRSNDCYGAFPGNMLFLTYLGLKFVDKLKEYYPLLEFEGINYNSTSLHIYEHDLPLVEKLLKK